jgi:hypothetical protein
MMQVEAKIKSGGPADSVNALLNRFVSYYYYSIFNFLIELLMLNKLTMTKVSLDKMVNATVNSVSDKKKYQMPHQSSMLPELN